MLKGIYSYEEFKTNGLFIDINNVKERFLLWNWLRKHKYKNLFSHKFLPWSKVRYICYYGHSPRYRNDKTISVYDLKRFKKGER